MTITPPTSTPRAALATVLAAWVSLSGCGGAPNQSASPAPGAASTEKAADKRQLTGTAWRLVEIQMKDGAGQARRPDDRAKYTMRLQSDGTVAMQLNCNRATGSWSADPGSDATKGGFTFGPLAGTRALCPPPSLDESILMLAPQVRDYLIRDGRLLLNLADGGGMLVWEPADIEVPFATTSDPALEAAVLAAGPGFTKKVAAAAGPAPNRYVHSRVDLNGDGQPEVLVFLMGPYFCGTGGCTLQLFSEKQGRYALISTFPISRPPVIVSPKRTRAWSDLFRLESGGGAAPSYVRHVFDGKTYVEAGRTAVGQVPPEGRWLLSGELGPSVGAPLTPRE